MVRLLFHQCHHVHVLKVHLEVHLGDLLLHVRLLDVRLRGVHRPGVHGNDHENVQSGGHGDGGEDRDDYDDHDDHDDHDDDDVHVHHGGGDGDIQVTGKLLPSLR